MIVTLKSAPGAKRFSPGMPGLFLIFLVAAILVSLSPARARTRDQVLSRAFGCSEIADARVWLDCYYGAAQPLRAALGLQPAPAGQVSLVLSPPAGQAPQAAEIRDTVLSAASHCGGGDRPWLECYYAAAQPMRAHLNLSPALQAAPTPPREGAAQSVSISDRMPAGPDEGFGLGNDSSRLKFVMGRMASYKFNKKGIFTVTLSNGQVWRQLSGDTGFAHWDGNAERYVVRVSRGFLGSYNLEVRNSPGMFKVHRIR